MQNPIRSVLNAGIVSAIAHHALAQPLLNPTHQPTTVNCPTPLAPGDGSCYQWSWIVPTLQGPYGSIRVHNDALPLGQEQCIIYEYPSGSPKITIPNTHFTMTHAPAFGLCFPDPTYNLIYAGLSCDHLPIGHTQQIDPTQQAIPNCYSFVGKLIFGPDITIAGVSGPEFLGGKPSNERGPCVVSTAVGLPPAAPGSPGQTDAPVNGFLICGDKGLAEGMYL